MLPIPILTKGLKMRDYLGKKYSYLGQGKPCNASFLQEELLCSNSLARLHIKEVLGVQKVSFTLEELITVVEVSLDLDE